MQTTTTNQCPRAHCRGTLYPDRENDHRRTCTQCGRSPDAVTVAGKERSKAWNDPAQPLGGRARITHGSLPEHVRWRDDGCAIAAKCQECPLPACRYDLPPGTANRLFHSGQLYRLLCEGLSVEAAARKLGIGRRTANRLRREMLDVLPNPVQVAS
jgi:hypothetical protein